MADVTVEGDVPSVGQPVEPASRHHDDCVICLSTITERAVASPCNHCCFDFICLASWINEQPRCPLCKAAVNAIEYDWRSSTDFKTYHVTETCPKSAPKTPQQPIRRGRARQHNRVDPPNAVDLALIRRRNVYRHNLFSLHVGSNRISGFRAITAAMVAASPALQTRAKKWIRRELLVFDGIRQTGPSSPSRKWAAGRLNNAEHLLEHIIDLLKVVDIRSEEMQALLTPYVGHEHAILFLHELSSWMRSPFSDLESWDRFVQYPARSTSSSNYQNT